jgi:hypothetical protein
MPDQKIMMKTLAVLLVSAAFANAAQAADPPSRVARLADLRGPVSFSPAGTDDWGQASLNRPVVEGDRLWTDAGGRDELQLGGAAVRMAGNTLVSVLTLDDRALQLRLGQGTLDVTVRPGYAAGVVEIDTPNLAFSIQQPGHYRVDVDPAGNATTVRVADGQAQAIGQDQAYLVNPGQSFRFFGNDLRNVQALDPRYRDDFDRWSDERDNRVRRRVASVRYVSPATIGYEDLDDYGSWRTVSGYGPVWTPARVERGWAPYRDGHWAWIAPWGWTWVDDAPWGFAVTHYGRWANFDGNWGWVPGPARAAPVYAPALVVFATNLALSRQPQDRGVAWFPLAPREAYRPPYPASPRYVTVINNSNTYIDKRTNTTNVYVNQRVDGAITAVPHNVFVRAQPVHPASVPVAREAIARAPLATAAMLQAQHESMANHLAGGHRPAPAALARPVMTHMRPAVAAAAPAHASAAMASAAHLPVPVPAAPPPAHQPGAGPHAAPLPLPVQGARELAGRPMPQPAPIAPLPPAAPPAMATRQDHRHGARQADGAQQATRASQSGPPERGAAPQPPQAMRSAPPAALARSEPARPPQAMHAPQAMHPPQPVPLNTAEHARMAAPAPAPMPHLSPPAHPAPAERPARPIPPAPQARPATPAAAHPVPAHAMPPAPRPHPAPVAQHMPPPRPMPEPHPVPDAAPAPHPAPARAAAPAPHPAVHEPPAHPQPAPAQHEGPPAGHQPPGKPAQHPDPHHKD